MVNLDNYKNKIDNFILETAQRFKAQNGNPNSIGVYCCPWLGWLTINFNLKKSLEQANDNCPDFEFVEFDALDFPDWREEYESNEPTYQLRSEVIKFIHEQGDEGLNKLFFSYLLPIVTETRTKIKHTILLQFLDSTCFKILETE